MANLISVLVDGIGALGEGEEREEEEEGRARDLHLYDCGFGMLVVRWVLMIRELEVTFELWGLSGNVEGRW